ADGQRTHYSLADDPSVLRSQFALIEDRQGHIWVGSTFGASRVRDGRIEEIYRGTPVWRILEGRDGNVWLGTNSQGLQRYSHNPFVHFGADQVGSVVWDIT